MSKRKNPKNPSEGERTGSALTRRDFLKIAGVAAGAAAASQIPGSVLAANPKPLITTPTITCALNGTDGNHVINITVCAPGGGTGLPAGFSVQWMTCDSFDNGTTVSNPLGGPDIVINYPGQWPADSDAAAAAGVLCKSSFSGNANQTIYNLAAGVCLPVYAGNFSNGADPNNPYNNPSLGYSTSCAGPLECDECYIFRAFGHATSSYKRSEYSLPCESTTDACDELPGHFSGCTKTQGYFKNNGVTQGTTACAVATASFAANNPINGITFTTAVQVATYLDTTGKSGPSALQKQLLTLALNIAVSAGACPNYCSDTCVKNPETDIVSGCAVYPAGFGAAVICGIVDGLTPLTASTTFPAGSEVALNGKTVEYVFDTINAGGDFGVPALDRTALLTLLNESFDEVGEVCCQASDFGLNHLFVGGCPA